MCKPSFIDESSLTKLSTGEFIIKTFYLEKRGIKELKNLDLSEVDFSGKNSLVKRNFDEWEINNVIFSRFNSKSSGKKYLNALSFKDAKMDRVSFVQAFLDRCNFDWKTGKQTDKLVKKQDSKTPPNLEKVDYFYSELNYCRFRDREMEKVDFRYAKVSDCSMNKTNITYGDFYDCNFKGCTAFMESNFTKCSFTNAVFEHQVINFDKIHHILQDDYNEYEKIVIKSKDWVRYNPTGKESKISKTEEEVLVEAKEMYRLLSGIYAGKGLSKDSNEAYRKMKKKELREYWRKVLPNRFINQRKKALRKFWEKANKSVSGLLLFLVLLGFLFCTLFEYGYICKVAFYCLGVFILVLFYNCIKKPLQDMWQKIEGYFRVVSGCFIYFMGYGYRWVNVIIVYVVLILFGAVGYYCYKADGNCSCLDALNSSFYNIISLKDSLAKNGCWGLLAGFHHLLGVLLIGYLGFIFANKMRNNL